MLKKAEVNLKFGHQASRPPCCQIVNLQRLFQRKNSTNIPDPAQNNLKKMIIFWMRKLWNIVIIVNFFYGPIEFVLVLFFHEVKEMYIYNTYIQYDDMTMTSTWHDSGDDKSIVNIIYDGDDDVDPIEFVYPLCLVESIFHCQTTFTRKSKPLPNNNSSRIHLSTWSKYLSTIKIICKQEPNYLKKLH